MEKKRIITVDRIVITLILPFLAWVSKSYLNTITTQAKQEERIEILEGQVRAQWQQVKSVREENVALKIATEVNRELRI